VGLGNGSSDRCVVVRRGKVEWWERRNCVDQRWWGFERNEGAVLGTCAGGSKVAAVGRTRGRRYGYGCVKLVRYEDRTSRSVDSHAGAEEYVGEERSGSQKGDLDELADS